MSVIKLPKGDGTWETLKLPAQVNVVGSEINTFIDFNMGFDATILWRRVSSPFINKPSDMTQSSGYIPVYMPYEGFSNTGIQVVYGTVGTDIGKIWMRRCDNGTWGAWALVAGEEMEKATGSDINTGIDDIKYVTPKAIVDSNVLSSSDGSVVDIITCTKAEYDAIETKDENTLYNITDDDSEANSEVLWTNTSPTSSFAGQTVTLANSNYNYLEVYYQRYPSADNRVLFQKIPKGYSSDLFYADYDSGNVRNWNRTFTRVSDTRYIFSGGSINNSTDNAALVPLKIIGYRN